MFTGNSVSKVINNHSCGVHAIYKYSGGIITGDKSGTVKVWDTNMSELFSFSIKELTANKTICLDYGLASLCFSSDESKLLVGTMGSDILEFNIDVDNKSVGSFQRLASGHCKDELWGCTSSLKYSDILFSVGDDNSVYFIYIIVKNVVYK